MCKTSKPNYEHDCNKCTFLGSFEPKQGDYSGTVYDLYVCRNPLDSNLGTVIARYGKYGDYMSGLVFAAYKINNNNHDYPLAEALKRAVKEGIYTQNEYEQIMAQ